MGDVVDTETLEMLKEVMEDDFPLLLQTFIDDALTRIPQLREQLDANNADELRRNAHSLKGSSGNVGAAGMTEICSRLESLANQSQLQEAGDIINAIEAEFGRVRSALNALL
ncbi:MAG: Hpt domain-containing protein [Candidatus Pelagadaptatus aseana]|uniref:Hpt domain-containing protein n=1 Tax=Candidatus Pelagadaptatus aseana TaxID=3120508 RepID=UPI0039B34B6D